MKNMISYLIEKYDNLIYKIAYNPIKRICERNPGNGYLFQLYINDWVKDHPLTDELKERTDQFYKYVTEGVKPSRKLIRVK
jgi:hypothetical protein